MVRASSLEACSRRAPESLPAQPLRDPTQLSELVLLQNASRPQGWHDWFASLGYQTEHSYHGPRFDTFYMCIRNCEADRAAL